MIQKLIELVSYYTRMIEITASYRTIQNWPLNLFEHAFFNLQCDIQVNCFMKFSNPASCLHFVVLNEKANISFNGMSSIPPMLYKRSFVLLIYWLTIVYCLCLLNVLWTEHVQLQFCFVAFLSNFEEELVCCKLCVIN